MKQACVVLALIALLGLTLSGAMAQGQGNGQGKGQRWGANLTEAQRTELQAKIKEMRAQGAKPEEIKAAVQELFKGWGVEMPAKGQGLGKGLGANLTEEQWTQLEAKLKELRGKGAKPEEIRAAMQELFKGWGPEMPGKGQGGGPGDRFGANLTEAQRTELQAKIKEMRAQGAKPEEIKAAVQELFKGWGVEMPQGKGQGGGNRFGANLTEAQRTQLQAKTKELQAAGAKPKEIRTAIEEMLKGWGLEMPQGAKDGRGKRGGLMEGVLKDLTPEQRQRVLTKMDEMQKAGSTQEEIKRTIMEMVKEFGDKA